MARRKNFSDDFSVHCQRVCLHNFFRFHAVINFIKSHLFFVRFVDNSGERKIFFSWFLPPPPEVVDLSLTSYGQTIVENLRLIFLRFCAIWNFTRNLKNLLFQILIPNCKVAGGGGWWEEAAAETV